MEGTDRRRFCEACQLHVHNVSAMSLAEREEFKRQLTGPACVTYEVRSDGTMAAPPRFPTLQKWLRAAAAAVAAVVPFFTIGCATPPPMATGGLLPPRRNDFKTVKSTTEKQVCEKTPARN